MTQEQALANLLASLNGAIWSGRVRMTKELRISATHAHMALSGEVQDQARRDIHQLSMQHVRPEQVVSMMMIIPGYFWLGKDGEPMPNKFVVEPLMTLPRVK